MLHVTMPRTIRPPIARLRPYLTHFAPGWNPCSRAGKSQIHHGGYRFSNPSAIVSARRQTDGLERGAAASPDGAAHRRATKGVRRLVHRQIFSAIFALSLALSGCTRIEDGDLPGPPPDITYNPAILGADGPAWRYFEQRPDTDAPAVPFVAFSGNGFTISLSCFGTQARRPIRIGAAERDVFHTSKTVAVRYQFDQGEERQERWNWYRDTAAANGTNAAAFARDVAKRNVLRFRLQGGEHRTVSLKGSAGPVNRLLKACGYPAA